MRVAIGTSGWDAPAGFPVALTELRTGEVLGYYRSVTDAAEHRRLLESADTIPEDDDDDEDLPPDMIGPGPGDWPDDE